MTKMTETKTTDSGLSGLCGCVSPVRYTVPGDTQDLGACNKYARCPSYAELQQQERHLRQQLDVARDYLHDLIHEWSWKKGERAGLGREYQELLDFHEQVRQLTISTSSTPSEDPSS